MLLTCRETRVRLDDFCDGHLSLTESLAVNAHIARCADCRRVVAAHESVVSLVRSATELPAPAGYFDSLPMRLSARITAARDRSGRTRYVASFVAMTSVAAALVAILLYKPVAPEPVSSNPLRKPIAAGLSVHFDGRRNPLTPEPTTNKPVSERIYRKDASREVMWVSLIEETPRSTEWDVSPPSVASPSPETQTPETWMALATLSSEGQPLWKYDTRLVSEPDTVPVAPARRSDAKPTRTPSDSGLAAFVTASPAVVSEPKFPVETATRKRR